MISMGFQEQRIFIIIGFGLSVSSFISCIIYLSRANTGGFGVILWFLLSLFLTIVTILMLVVSAIKIEQEATYFEYIKKVNKIKHKLIKVLMESETPNFMKAIGLWNRAIKYLEIAKIEVNKFNPSLIPEIEERIKDLRLKIQYAKVEQLPP